MRVSVWHILTIVMACDLTLWGMETAGKAKKPPRSDRDLPKPVDALRSEKHNLTEAVYAVFARAVDLQLKGDDAGAMNLYNRLRRLKRKDGSTVDLAAKSPALGHNISLLKKK